MIAEQLKGLKLNFKAYGALPIREDVYVIEHPDKEIAKARGVLKQWEKLKYLREHLQTLDSYLKKNKGETLREWLKANDAGLSKMVLEAIGNHNDSTGGISIYFLNLQNHYDEVEEAYDKMEALCKVPKDIAAVVPKLREERETKRRGRRKERKIRLKDLKTNGKGYLVVDAPPAPETQSADAVKTEEKKNAEEAAEKTVAEVTKRASNIGIWIAGITITVAVVAGVAAAMNKKE